MVQILPTKKSRGEKKDKLKKNTESKHQEDLLQEAMKVLKDPIPVQDQYDVFGQFIAGELRGFANDDIRKRVKREITTVILKWQEQEEQTWSSRSGTPSPASWTCSLLSPIHTPNASQRSATTSPSCSNVPGGFSVLSPPSQSRDSSLSSVVSAGILSQAGYGSYCDQYGDQIH